MAAEVILAPPPVVQMVLLRGDVVLVMKAPVLVSHYHCPELLLVSFWFS
jgi:hypothetical protein